MLELLYNRSIEGFDDTTKRLGLVLPDTGTSLVPPEPKASRLPNSAIDAPPACCLSSAETPPGGKAKGGDRRL